MVKKIFAIQWEFEKYNNDTLNLDRLVEFTYFKLLNYMYLQQLGANVSDKAAIARFCKCRSVAEFDKHMEVILKPRGRDPSTGELIEPRIWIDKNGFYRNSKATQKFAEAAASRSQRSTAAKARWNEEGSQQQEGVQNETKSGSKTKLDPPSKRISKRVLTGPKSLENQETTYAGAYAGGYAGAMQTGNRKPETDITTTSRADNRAADDAPKGSGWDAPPAGSDRLSDWDFAAKIAAIAGGEKVTVQNVKLVERWRDAGHDDDRIVAVATEVIRSTPNVRNAWALLTRVMPDRLVAQLNGNGHAKPEPKLDPATVRKNYLDMCVRYFRGKMEWPMLCPPPGKKGCTMAQDIIDEAQQIAGGSNGKARNAG